MNETDRDFEVASLGIEAEKFLHSPLGRYLAQRAETEVLEARLLMDNVDPEDPRAIRELQNRIHVPSAVMNWFTEAIIDGIAAEQRIRNEEAEASD